MGYFVHEVSPEPRWATSCTEYRQSRDGVLQPRLGTSCTKYPQSCDGVTSCTKYRQCRDGLLRARSIARAAMGYFVHRVSPEPRWGTSAAIGYFVHEVSPELRWGNFVHQVSPVPRWATSCTKYRQSRDGLLRAPSIARAAMGYFSRDWVLRARSIPRV